MAIDTGRYPNGRPPWLAGAMGGCAFLGRLDTISRRRRPRSAPGPVHDRTPERRRSSRHTGPRVSVALLGALLVAACGASGGAPASSPVAAATESPSSNPVSLPTGVAVASCVPRPGYSSVPDGTRVDDLADGFSITLPHGWAQIELATGNVVPAFSGLTMERRTAALVRTIGSSAESAGYEWLAVDLAPGAGGSQSATPADLLVDLSPANGATLDTIAARLTTDLRGSGVTGNIEQIRFVLAVVMRSGSATPRSRMI
jgi:hypothetical protein